MRNKRRLVSILLTAAVAASILMGCSQGETEQTPAVKETGSNEAATSEATGINADDQPVKNMVYLTCITPQQSGYISMERVVEKYQKEVNPNFTMDIQYIADKPAYLQKLKTLVASDEMPNMFNIDTDPYAITLLKEGLVQDLNPVIDKYGLDEVFLAAPLSWGRTSDGIQIGLPLDYSIEVFWYNKKMFEAAGVKEPETFREFLDVCASLKENGSTPISVSGKEAWPILRYLLCQTYRNGGNEFLQDLARGKQKMSSDVGMKAVEFVRELGIKGYFQTGFASMDYTAALDYFLGGNAAMYYMGTWDLQFFQNDKLSDDMKDNIGYFLMPTLDEGTVVGTANFVANSTMPIGFATDKFDAETERFIEFYASNISEALDGLAFSCAKNGKLPNDSELTKQLAADMEKSTGSINLFDIELDPATNELIGKEAVSLALGDITPDEFAKHIDASIEENASDFFGDN